MARNFLNLGRYLYSYNYEFHRSKKKKKANNNQLKEILSKTYYNKNVKNKGNKRILKPAKETKNI